MVVYLVRSIPIGYYRPRRRFHVPERAFKNGVRGMYLHPEDILSPLSAVETIAAGPKIREIRRLRKQYGKGRWRKVKGIAHVRLPNGKIRNAELHWYEAHGIGKKEFKIKRYLA